MKELEEFIDNEVGRVVQKRTREFENQLRSSLHEVLGVTSHPVYDRGAVLEFVTEVVKEIDGGSDGYSVGAFQHRMHKNIRTGVIEKLYHSAKPKKRKGKTK